MDSGPNTPRLISNLVLKLICSNNLPHVQAYISLMLSLLHRIYYSEVDI